MRLRISYFIRLFLSYIVSMSKVDTDSSYKQGSVAASHDISLAYISYCLSAEKQTLLNLYEMTHPKTQIAAQNETTKQNV